MLRLSHHKFFGSPTHDEWIAFGTVQDALLMTPRQRQLAELCVPLLPGIPTGRAVFQLPVRNQQA